METKVFKNTFKDILSRGHNKQNTNSKPEDAINGMPDGLIITSHTADLSYCKEVPNCN